VKAINISTKFFAGEVVVKEGTYPNGSKALQLVSVSGEPLATATVALDALPEEGNVFIKDWSENEGVLAALQDAGVVGPVIRSIPTGFVQAYEVKVLEAK
jgi:hypothetical protein